MDHIISECDSGANVLKAFIFYFSSPYILLAQSNILLHTQVNRETFLQIMAYTLKVNRRIGWLPAEVFIKISSVIYWK